MPHDLTKNDESSIAPAKNGTHVMGKVADDFS